MKVLILVLSARRDPWGSLMMAQMETWDSIGHAQTQTMYYCGKLGQGEYVACPTPIFFSPSLTESLEDVSPRTIEAFEKSLELEWDYMARVHSSTYVHKKNLVDFIETLPKENVLCGLLTTGPSPFLWGGGSYIISRDVIEAFVANKDKWNHNVMEDVGMTKLAKELDIPFTGGRMASINQNTMGLVGWLVMQYGFGENLTGTDLAGLIKKAGPHYYWRCKQDLERHKDVEIFRKLKEHLP